MAAIERRTLLLRDPWKPASWTTPYRFLFIRQQVRRQDKATVQLDLFKPTEVGYEFEVIVTN